MASPSKKVLNYLVLRCCREGELPQKVCLSPKKCGVTHFDSSSLLTLRVSHYRRVGKVVLRRGRRCGDELVAGDFCRNAHTTVPGGLDAHNLALAADIYITRLRDLLRKSDHEFNFAANFEISVSDKVQATVTDVARVRVKFASLCP